MRVSGWVMTLVDEVVGGVTRDNGGGVVKEDK